MLTFPFMLVKFQQRYQNSHRIFRNLLCCAVILPTGDVFVSGGVNDPVEKRDRFGVLTPEIYHPEADLWEVVEFDEAKIVRNYHSVALLMPDGRVWTAGSNHDGKNSKDGTDTHEPAVPHLRAVVSLPAETADHGLPARHALQTIRERRLLLQDPNAARRHHDARRDPTCRVLDSRVQLGPALRRTRIPCYRRERTGCHATESGGDCTPRDYLLFILDQNNVPSKGTFVWIGEPPRTPGVRPPRVSQPFAIHNDAELEAGEP
jgi:hypothetical protein